MTTMSDASSMATAAVEEPSKKLLEELCAKFILTAPKDALSKDKLFFLVEQCWWYYEDKVRPAMRDNGVNLKHYSSYTTFAEPLFRKCEALSPLRPNLQAYLEDYRRYKQSIPVYGAILLDAAMEQVLLVRGNKSSMGWGFPRGKVNEGEKEADCAVREVLEETGYDIKSKLREDHYLEVTADGKRHKLYIVTGLDPTTQEFQPHSLWEIGAYAWHRVDALPATADEASQVYMSPDGVRHRFFMIHPFISRLRKWIKKHGGSGAYSVPNSAHTSLQIPREQLQAMAATAAASALGNGNGTPNGTNANGGRRGDNQRAGRNAYASGAGNGPGVSLAAAAAAAAAALSGDIRPPGLAPAAPPVPPAAAQSSLSVPHPVLPASRTGSGSTWVPSMANFRFDREPIMRCFPVAA
ncbi:hypothetical protein HYH03_009767 [Edaphochlamys debaryana]|uniref:Nudix hydrolase domain-containing protein n=1 Tax=Edaphochlamys debaryana TaxID=47281 RepID=A0A835XZT7_9CHLO|nr:hypothetical protein HYH03_009767 [Edaphochlamys debaryana]|eukprot:KAG2492038.1 hypothetical protein HYH03_009767 [Edaphochlamys debaryana]